MGYRSDVAIKIYGDEVAMVEFETEYVKKFLQLPELEQKWLNDIINDYNTKTDSLNDRYQNAEGNMNVNPFWYQEQFTGKVLAFLSEAFAALKTAGYYSNTDIQSDYFDDAYYYGIEIGQWDKPYELIK